jgi:hypothetical protein|tara:strand:+ start:1016 stop:3010 length:1995 start_codon:yes stop_codon:yes gene_type:complete
MALEDDIKKGKIEAQEFAQVIMDLDSTFKSLAVTFAESITNQTKEANSEAQKLAKTYSNDLTKGIKDASNQNAILEEIQSSLNQGNKITLAQQNKINKAERNQLVTLRKIEQAKQEGIVLSAEQLIDLEENYKKQNKITGAIQERAKAQEKSLGAVGKISGAFTGLLDKLGMGDLNKFFNLDKANAASKKTLESLGKNVGVGKKIGVVTGNIVKNLDMGALAAGGLFKLAGSLFDAYKKQDQAVTNIARNLSTSKDEAKALKGEMFESSIAAGAFGITMHDQIDAVNALNKGLGGTALSFNKDIREGAADTLKRLKLSEEAVSNMGTLAMATGKSFKVLEKEQAKGVLDAEREFGVRLNLKSVLDESNKITGLARVNAMGIEGGLAKAVSTAKSLGIEMSAVAGSAGQLLDFESSIQNELQAELLIGRDLNLEKARAAALAGDQEALAKALVEEAGSLEELQGMNVIQQQALAGALGMSADQLADSLVTGEALSTQAQADLDRDAQKALEQEKMLSLTEKQAVAMEKFSETVGMLGKGLLIAAAAAAAVAIAMTFGVASLPILAGIALAGAAVGGIASTVADGVAPPGSGPFTIQDKFGATTITAAGDGLAVSPNINTTGGAGGNANMGETNMLLKQILSKEGTVKMDSTEVGTAFSVGSRQIQ